ncbi:hypothetical protein H0N95_02230 [Candidatus Micrarchaeota archaeon]|nr:hypothetical protein [Candidatus Micrarchaeota archaeon]
MELNQYYELLEPKDGDRILVTGDKSIPIALYLAGVANKKSMKVSCVALVSKNAEIKSDIEEVEIARKNYLEHLSFIEAGLPYSSFEKTELESYSPRETFSKCVVKKDTVNEGDFIKLGKIVKGKVLFVLPLRYFRHFEVAEKGTFIHEFKDVSFRQALRLAGFAVLKYEISDDKLVALTEIVKVDERMLKSGIKPVPLEKSAKIIADEIEHFVQFAENGSKFAVESDDREYLYIITVADVQNAPYKYSITFLDGKAEAITTGVRMNSKKFSVIAVPNIETFRAEAESKDIIIIGKEKVQRIFGRQRQSE